jgi:hypothetical protein
VPAEVMIMREVRERLEDIGAQPLIGIPYGAR